MAMETIDSLVEYFLPAAPPPTITGVPHSLFLNDFTSPTWCTKCRGYLWGMQKQGYSCGICSSAYHHRCVSSALETCSLKSPLAKKLPLLRAHRSDSALHFTHKWKPLSEIELTPCCASCDTLLLTDESRECTRCHTYVHVSCLPSMPKDCHPKHANLIYVPSYDNYSREELLAQQEKVVLAKEEGAKEGPPAKRTRLSSSLRSPLLVFVNPKSGNQMGSELVEKFREVLSDEQVIDLTKSGGPIPVLERFMGVKGLRILVCGGDGTVGWVLGSIQKVDFVVHPPVAVMPLGTGNDLARTINWGKAYENDRVTKWLMQVEHSTPQKFDVWRLRTTPIPQEGKVTPEGLDILVNNYCSLGIDAKVVLDFHTFREANPHLASGQLLNKFWYTFFGSLLMLHFPEKFENVMTIKIDGVTKPFSPEIEGLMLMNTPNYAGGANPWGAEPAAPLFTPPSIDDGKVEMVSVTGSFHMANVCVDFVPAIRFGQASKIEIQFRGKDPLPMQVDGEPLVLDACDILMERSHQVTLLKKVDPSS